MRLRKRKSSTVSFWSAAQSLTSFDRKVRDKLRATFFALSFEDVPASPAAVPMANLTRLTTTQLLDLLRKKKELRTLTIGHHGPVLAQISRLVFEGLANCIIKKVNLELQSLTEYVCPCPSRID